MKLPQYTITIVHEKYETILKETFLSASQFKLFLKMVQGCVELKNDLTFFNGSDFFIHIPYKYLVESLITTKVDDYSLVEHFNNKSKIEALVTK